MSASSLYLETFSLAAPGEVGWRSGRHGARGPHVEAIADILAGVIGDSTGLVAVGMESHGHV